MFKYLLAPFLRPVIRLSLFLVGVAFIVPLPARLWVRYVDANPGDGLVIAFNVGTFGLIVAIMISQYFNRCRSRRWRGPK